MTGRGRPGPGTSPVELALHSILFGELFFFADGVPQPGLALSAEPDPAGGGAANLTLCDGGVQARQLAFGAADVVHTFAHRASPERTFPSELTAYFDLANARVVDDRTVRVSTARPDDDRPPPCACCAVCRAPTSTPRSPGLLAEQAQHGRHRSHDPAQNPRHRGRYCAGP